MPRDTDGLLLAGRCVSGTHAAHASYRVQCIAMAIGAGAGTAAAVAVKQRVPNASIKWLNRKTDSLPANWNDNAKQHYRSNTTSNSSMPDFSTNTPKS